MVSVPRQVYGFQPSPPTDGALADVCNSQQFYGDNVTLVVEDAGVVVAEASAISMQQNLRGSMYPMAGIAGVATSPLARRRGYGRAVVVELLGQMRDEGRVLSCLYPFRPSFYQRFGYVGLPKAKTASFAPTDLAGLLDADLPGEVSLSRVRDGYDAYRAFTRRVLTRRHGFAELPDRQGAQLREADDRWLAMAHVDGEVVAAVTYRITKFGGELLADHLLAMGPMGRALLLQFFARHIDQVSRIVVSTAPDEFPELWATDLAVAMQTQVAFPVSPAPLARVLSLEALGGVAVGSGRVVIEVVDDPLIAGSYELAAVDGSLELSRSPVAAPTASLTVPGISGLVYGVLDPADIVVRGLGRIPSEAQQQLRSLFPRAVPYLFADF